MLEFDDIQHILLTRAPALAARYEFLSFRNPSAGRRWITAIMQTVHSAADARASVDEDKRWVTVGFTWNGLRALGVDAARSTRSRKSSSRAWRRGRRSSATRVRIIPTIGWAALPARTCTPSPYSSPATAERDRCVRARELVARCEGVEVLSSLDLDAIPPFGYAHDISATATGSRSRSSRARATSRRPARAVR